MIILLTKEVKKGDGDGVPVSRDQTWHRERETEESSDEEYHERFPLDWGYISSSLSPLSPLISGGERVEHFLLT